MSPRSTLREKRSLVLFSSLCLFWWRTRFLVRLPLHPPVQKQRKLTPPGGGLRRTGGEVGVHTSRRASG
jgi:hypothetical protein